MGDGTHIRIGGTRIALRAGSTLRDAAGFLSDLCGVNIRAIRDTPRLREEALRRVLSPPCASRCYVRRDGPDVIHDCVCASGFQYASDPEAQELEACPARDVWNDFASLVMAHEQAGRGTTDPIVADCDCLTPAAVGVAAWLAWFGTDVWTRYRDPTATFAVGITLPPAVQIAHCYALTNRRPPSPQPPITLPFEGGPWYVWDAAAHWGMPRPPNQFYTLGEKVAYPIVQAQLDGLKLIL